MRKVTGFGTPRGWVDAGYLYCFKTDGYGPVEWGLFGGDSHNTRNAACAYAYGQRLYGYQWKWRPERAR
jgi:hypothetical protein